MPSHFPALFLSHGSPLQAILDTPANRIWKTLPERWSAAGQPRAVLVISAHWESELPLVSSATQPQTIHDFGGFPEPLCQLQYAAPGAPALAQQIGERLRAAGIPCALQGCRGLDHGAWVPLRYLYPAAKIPVLQLSVQPHLDAAHHYRVGQTLQTLSAEGVLILASGHATHNLREWQKNAALHPQAQQFRDWLQASLQANDLDGLLNWAHAPGAAYAHPTPEHFLPFFVALGAASQPWRAELLVSGWEGQGLALDSYLFVRAA